MRSWPVLRVSGLASPAREADLQTSDLVQATLADHAVAAVEELSPDEWRVFFSTEAEREAAGTAIASAFPALHLDRFDIADDDWARKSQAHLQAIRAGRITVAPPWDVQDAVDGLQIVIEPSMGFGTGHHATTRLCLQALQDVTLVGGGVVDVGTGSGVLAIAASLLGAARVVGLDDDPDAVQAARGNLAFNTSARVEFLVCDLRAYEDSGFDVATANLTGGLLAAAAPTIERLVRPGGTLVLSGLLPPEVVDVVPRFTGCTPVARADEDGWVALTLERRSP